MHGRASLTTKTSRALVATAATAASRVRMRNPSAQPAGVNFNSRKNESLGGVASSALSCEDFNYLLPGFIDSADRDATALSQLRVHGSIHREPRLRDR